MASPAGVSLKDPTILQSRTCSHDSFAGDPIVIPDATILPRTGSNAATLKAAGISALQLRAAGFPAHALRAAAFNAAELHHGANFDPIALVIAGFSSRDLKGAGVSSDVIRTHLASECKR